LIKPDNKDQIKLGNPASAIAIFTFLSFLPAAIGFFLLPIYLQHFDPSEYGSLTLFNLFGGFYGIFATLKLDQAARTNYYDYIAKPDELIKYKSSIFSSSILIALLTFLVTWILGHCFFDLIFIESSLSFYPIGFTVLCSVFLGQFTAVIFIFLKNEYDLNRFAGYTICLVLLNAIFQYHLIVNLDYGVLGSVLGALIAKLILAICVLSLNYKMISLSPSIEMLKDSLKFSIPFIPFVFLNWFFMNGDRILLERLLDLNELGKYALLINIILLVKIFFNALTNAFRPYLYLFFKDLESHKVAIEKIIFWFSTLGLLAISGTIMIGNNINLLTDSPSYLAVVPLFSLGGLIMIPRLLLQLPALQLVYLKKSKFISLTTFISLIILVLLFHVLVPKLGLRGALYSLGIMNIVQCVWFYIDAQRNLKLNYPYLSILAMTTIFTLGLMLLQTAHHEGYMTSNIFGMIQFIYCIVIATLALLLLPKYRKFNFEN